MIFQDITQVPGLSYSSWNRDERSGDILMLLLFVFLLFLVTFAQTSDGNLHKPLA